MDSLSVRFPYKHIREAELELVGLDEAHVRMDGDSRVSNGPCASSSSSSTPNFRGLKTLILGSMVAAGVQFGWALQLSLLTPYIQTLGIEHALSSFIWLCGPITGLVVQPCVGIWSDKCKSKFGRRRPFIFIGTLLISVAVTIIGFSADIGYFLGDTKEHCSTYKGNRVWATLVFIIGFWMLDLANNTVQGPARALLADLSGPNQRNSANAIFCSWMAVGNILGFSSGASGNWHRWFPFLTTRACCEACGNLKAAFLVAVVVLGISSFLVEPMCQQTSAKLVWVMSNFIVFICMAGTAVISLVSVSEYSKGIQHMIGGNEAIRIAALVVFALLGFPLSITYSVPFAVTAELTADTGGGQGLATGVLNLAIVIPQMIISLGAGPWDALFGGGNIPAFALASVFAFAAGVIAFLKLPKLSRSSFKSSGFHGLG